MSGLLTVVPGISFKVVNLIWKSACFNSVVASLEHIIGKLELSVDGVPLCLKSMTLIIEAAIAPNLHNGIPSVLVSNSLMEGVKGGTRTDKEAIEPGWYWVGYISSILGDKVEVGGEGLLIVTLPN
jgi:hypothetical protein